MISAFLKRARDLIQLLILVLLLVMFFKIFSFPSFDDLQDWLDYRRAIANIERKEQSSVMGKIEGFVLRLGRGTDKNKAVELLCRLGKQGKEEAELLLLIYDMGLSECAVEEN